MSLRPWQLEDTHHFGGHRHARHDRHHDHRGSHGPRYISGLCGRSFVSGAKTGDVVVMDNLSSHKVNGV